MSLTTILKGAMRRHHTDSSDPADPSGLLVSNTLSGATSNPYLNARRT